MAVTQFVTQFTYILRHFKVKYKKKLKKFCRENCLENVVSEIHKKKLVLSLKANKDYECLADPGEARGCSINTV